MVLSQQLNIIKEIIEKKNTQKQKSWFGNNYKQIMFEVNNILEKRTMLKKKSIFMSTANESSKTI